MIMEEGGGQERKESRNRISRRSFITGSAALFGCGAVSSAVSAFSGDEGDHEASFYTRLDGETVRCTLCPHQCFIPPGSRGSCRTRENRSGTLFSLVYGRACSMHLDPIEKKPFFHVLPGSKSLSISTVGCNMTCRFCQNWQISQSSPEEVSVSYTSPRQVVLGAERNKASSIAYTYGEPVVFFEYMIDTASLASSRSIMSVVVTNGYYGREALKELCGVVDAVKVDLKSFEESYYRDICGGTLKPVLDSLVEIKKSGRWLEIVYLMIPTLNDDPGMISEMSKWIVANLGPDVPVHYSRFFPQYRLANLPPTPLPSLERAWEISREQGIRYVYIGNVTGHRTESTYCHGCGKKVISRSGYRISGIDLDDGGCRFCGTPVPGLWKEKKA